MERTEQGIVITEGDIKKTREVLGWIGIGVLVIETARIVFTRKRPAQA